MAITINGQPGQIHFITPEDTHTVKEDNYGTYGQSPGYYNIDADKHPFIALTNKYFGGTSGEANEELTFWDYILKMIKKTDIKIFLAVFAGLFVVKIILD